MVSHGWRRGATGLGAGLPTPRCVIIPRGGAPCASPAKLTRLDDGLTAPCPWSNEANSSRPFLPAEAETRLLPALVQTAFTQKHALRRLFCSHTRRACPPLPPSSPALVARCPLPAAHPPVRCLPWQLPCISCCTRTARARRLENRSGSARTRKWTASATRKSTRLRNGERRRRRWNPARLTRRPTTRWSATRPACCARRTSS